MSANDEETFLAVSPSPNLLVNRKRPVIDLRVSKLVIRLAEP